MASTYDVPYIETYYIPSSAYGATTAAKTFIGPAGRVGLVTDILVLLSATAVGTTTVPEIDVGTASGDFTYARFRLGTTATAGYNSSASPLRARSIAGTAPGNTGGNPPALSDYTGHIALETTRLPANTNFVITQTQGVGGTPAGTWEAYIVVKWF
jgi:hypothetical protein